MFIEVHSFQTMSLWIQESSSFTIGLPTNIATVELQGSARQIKFHQYSSLAINLFGRHCLSPEVWFLSIVCAASCCKVLGSSLRLNLEFLPEFFVQSPPIMMTR